MNSKVFFVTFTLVSCFACLISGNEPPCLLESDFLAGMDKILIAERYVFLNEISQVSRMSGTGKWYTLTEEPVCFGPEDNKFASVVMPFEGFLTGLKLVHVRGQVTCDKSVPAHSSNWGCTSNHPVLGRTPLNIVITTDDTNRIIYPKKDILKDKDSLWYAMSGFEPDSPQLVFRDGSDPLYVPVGKELRVGYGEEVFGSGKKIKMGKVCVMLQGWFIH